MHELSIAMGIVDGAGEELARHPGERPVVVHLRLGQLSGVVKDALLFSYELACEGTPLAGSRLEVDEVPATIFCGECGEEKKLRSIQNFSCPDCGKATNEIVRGRELMIVGLELESEYAAAAG